MISLFMRKEELEEEGNWSCSNTDEIHQTIKTGAEERKTRDMNYREFGSNQYQRQSYENQETLNEYEMSKELSKEQVNVGLNDSLRVPNIVNDCSSP